MNHIESVTHRLPFIDRAPSWTLEQTMEYIDGLQDRVFDQRRVLARNNANHGHYFPDKNTEPAWLQEKVAQIFSRRALNEDSGENLTKIYSDYFAKFGIIREVRPFFSPPEDEHPFSLVLLNRKYKSWPVDNTVRLIPWLDYNAAPDLVINRYRSIYERLDIDTNRVDDGSPYYQINIKRREGNLRLAMTGLQAEDANNAKFSLPRRDQKLIQDLRSAIV